VGGQTGPVEGRSARETILALGELLRARFAAVRAWLEVDEATWNRRASPDAWSVGEIVEHVALTNHYLLILVRKLRATARKRAARGDPVDPAPPRFEHLDRIASRDFRWERPEHMAPTGRASRADLRAKLAEQEDECLAALRELPAGEGSLHRIRLSLLREDDRLDLYQFLHFLGLHLERHLAQLRRTAGETGGGAGPAVRA